MRGNQRVVGVVGALQRAGNDFHRGQRGEHRVVRVAGRVRARRSLVREVAAARLEPVPGRRGGHGDLVLTGDDQMPPGRHGNALAGVPVHQSGRGGAHRDLRGRARAVAGRESQMTAHAGTIDQRDRLVVRLHRRLRGRDGRPEEPGSAWPAAEVVSEPAPASLTSPPTASTGPDWVISTPGRGRRPRPPCPGPPRTGPLRVGGPDGDRGHCHHRDQEDVQGDPGAVQQSAQCGEQPRHDERS